MSNSFQSSRSFSTSELSSLNEHLCISLNNCSTNDGTIVWAVERHANTIAHTELAKKIKTLIDKHHETKHVLSTTLSPAYTLDISLATYQLVSKINTLLPQKTRFIKEQTILAHDTKKFINLSFRLRKHNGAYQFFQIVQVENTRIEPNIKQFKDWGVLLDNERISFWKNEQDLIAFHKTMPFHGITISAGELVTFFDEHIAPLLKTHVVHIDSQLISRYIVKRKPTAILFIQNKDDKVYFKIKFLYEDVEVVSPVLSRYYVFADNQSLVQVDRDAEEEDRLLNAVMSLHSNFEYLSDCKFAIPAKDLTESWCTSFYAELANLKIQVKNDINIERTVKTYHPTVQIKIVRDTNWFDAILDVKINNNMISVKSIQDAILENSKEVFIDDQSYKLADEWIKKYRNIFMWGKIKQHKLRFSNYQHHLFDTLDDKDFSAQRPKDIIKVNNNVTVPKGLKGDLRDYQKEGFQWINVLQQTDKGGILADDMGLGKTIQTLTQLLKFFETYQKLTAMIVCPASLINNWQEEILKFTPQLHFFVYHDQSRKLTSQEIENYQIIITSYNVLQKDIKILKNINFDYVVLDESQYIKNPHSKTTRAVFAINSKHKLCLSGTPLQNHTFDIYSQIHFLNPNVLGSIENFKNRFSILIDQCEENETRDELRQLLDPFILRRTKKQVAKELPEKSETIIYCTMEEPQREIYEYYRERYKNQLLSQIQRDGIQKSKFHIFQGFTFLRQICNSPELVKEGIPYNKTPIKLKMLQEKLIDKSSDNKALIFSQFIGMLGLIEQHIKKDKWNYAYFDGKTPLGKRTSEIERFQTDEDCKLFLISIKAGNVGLNLTAADYVYLIDPWWNPAIEQQAIDRTHRIGQSKNIFSCKFICLDTIEEKILALQKKKSHLADTLITLNQDSFIKNLNSEDIEYLFSH